MTPLDRWFVMLGSPLLAGAIALGAANANETVEDPDRGGRLLRAGGEDEVVGPVADPSTPPVPSNLPPGVKIDPNTLALTGLELKPDEGTEAVTWELLKSYTYQDGLANLADGIQAVDGKPVTMAGFLLPIYEFDQIKEFLLVGSHWSCCYGVPPSLEGVVHVRLGATEEGLPNTAEPLKVVGTFRAVERKQSGYVLSIYEIADARAQILRY
jgi:hypothetical protein